MRRILIPAALPAAALGELKDWLAITASGEDAPLSTALRAALDLCEGFTGLVPLECTGEEILAASSRWQRLCALPVHAIAAVEAMAPDGTRSPLPVAQYAIDLDPDGGARLHLTAPLATRRIAVRFTAGMAADWTALPDGLRHGVIRLAAEFYRDRTEASNARTPPAAVAALWRPWRRQMLA